MSLTVQSAQFYVANRYDAHRLMVTGSVRAFRVVEEAVQTKPNRGAKERACIVDTKQVTITGNERMNLRDYATTRRRRLRKGIRLRFHLNGVNWSAVPKARLLCPDLYRIGTPVFCS